MKKIFYGDGTRKYTCFNCKYYFNYSNNRLFIKGYCLQLNKIMDFNQMTVEDKNLTCDQFFHIETAVDIFDGLGLA